MGIFASIVGFGIRELLKALDPETVKELVDTLLDKVEDKVKATDSKLDDTIVLPLVASLRTILNIDDLKYGTDKE